MSQADQVEKNNQRGINFQNKISGGQVNQAKTIHIHQVAPAPAAVGVPNNLGRSGAVTFVGRRELLAELHKRVSLDEMSSIVSIRGMGGVGKSELVLQYALRYGKDYRGGLCFLRARASLGLQVIEFARSQLNLMPPENFEQAAQVAYCWRHWPAGEVLIVFDDVQHYEDIEPFLPPSQDVRFNVVLTTRVQLGGAVAELSLEFLSRAESLALLRALAGDKRMEAEPGQAKWLCEWLGDLPLGLELAGRYLEKKPTVSLTKLRGRLEGKRLDARALDKTYPGMTATAGIAAAFEVSWELLTEEAQVLAMLLSLYALAPVPWRLVESCFSDWDDDDLEDLEDWRDSLASLHLLRRLEPKTEENYQLHQLLREFFLSKISDLEDSEALVELFCISLVEEAEIIPQRLTLVDIKKNIAVIPHIEEVATFHYAVLPDEDLLIPFIGLGNFFQSQGLYAQAELWFRQSRKVAEERFPPFHPDIAHSLNNLAGLCWNQGRYEEAELLCQNSLEMRKQLLGEEHPDVASSLNNLAMLYDDQRRYEEAESLYQNALEMRKQLLGEDHPDVASSLNNLATIYETQERYEEAELLYQNALKMNKRLLGEDHPEIATNLNNLAFLYQVRGRYEEAELLYQNSLEMRKQLLGEDHPDVASSLNNLATIYETQERYEEAELLYQNALKMNKRLLGEDHPEIATNLNNLAFLYQVRGRYEEAELLYQNSLEMRKQLLGEDHPDVASSLNNLASLYQAQGRYEEAEPLYIRCLETWEVYDETYTTTPILEGNFLSFLEDFIENSSGQSLSDHPLTQDFLKKLQSEKLQEGRPTCD